MILLYKLITIYSLLIRLNDAVYSIPDTVSTQVGASYTIVLLDDNTEPKECFVKDINNGNVTYLIDLNTPGLPLVLTNDQNHNLKEKDTEILTSLGSGICGFKVDNVDKAALNYKQFWNISFIDGNRKVYYKNVEVNTKETKSRTVLQYIPAGSEFTIDCSNSDIDQVYYLNFCQLYNPRGELVKTDVKTCHYSKDISTISDYGRWKCILSYKNKMIETETYYDVFEKNANIIKTWKNETNTHVNIACSIANSTSAAEFCVMVRPDGQQFSLRSGLATLRYTSIHMNITKGICAIEIKKPLEPSEKGLWRCEFHHGAGYTSIEYSPIGGFINLSQDSHSLPPAIIPKQIFTHINESFTVSCRVPFSSNYCYMRGPDGIIYPVEDDRGSTLGLCKFTKVQATLADNGTWFCGFGKRTGEPDAVYSFDVFLPDTLAIKPDVGALEARTAGTITLKCSTQGLGDYPIKYCRFLSPSGQMYFIDPLISSKRISYAGRGFKYGDCGMKIKDVGKDDEGIWSCITRIGFDFKNPEVYSNIHVSINDNLSTASVFGITLGVGVVLIGIIIIVVHKLRRNRVDGFNVRFLNPFRRNAPARSSNSSDSSNNSAALFNVNDNNYHATYNAEQNIRQRVDGNP